MAIWCKKSRNVIFFDEIQTVRPIYVTFYSFVTRLVLGSFKRPNEKKNKIENAFLLVQIRNSIIIFYFYILYINTF